MSNPEIELQELMIALSANVNDVNNSVAEIAQTDKEIEALIKAANKLKADRAVVKARLANERIAIKAKETKAKQLTLQIEQKKTEDAVVVRVSYLDKKSSRFPWNKAIYASQREDAYRASAIKKLLIGNEMGTGKTITALASADLAGVRHLLVITPAKLSTNFVDEIQRWAPQRKIINLAGETTGIKNNVIAGMMHLHAVGKPTALVLNYEAWRNNWELTELLSELKFDGIIIDEAHYLKNKATNAFRGVKAITHAYNRCPRRNAETDKRCTGKLVAINNDRTCNNCFWSFNSGTNEEQRNSRSIQFVLPMSGTFLMNQPQDIWPSLNLIQPEIFQDEKTFLGLFARQDNDSGKYYFRSGGAESLAKQLGSCYIKRTLTDMGIELPPMTTTTVQVPFDEIRHAKQIEIVNNLRKHAAIILEETGDSIPMTAVIALIMRQRQANVFPQGIVIKNPSTGEVAFDGGVECNESAKLDYLENAISKDVLFDGKRVAVFSQFSQVFQELRNRLASLGLRVAVYDGSVSKSQAAIVRQDFTRGHPGDNQFDVVLANFKTGGAGLNFTDITRSYELDMPWNPAGRDQAKGRTRRIGQTEPTDYIILETPGSIDPWMRELINVKKDMISGFDNAQANASLSEMLKVALEGDFK